MDTGSSCGIPKFDRLVIAAANQQFASIGLGEQSQISLILQINSWEKDGARDDASVPCKCPNTFTCFQIP